MPRGYNFWVYIVTNEHDSVLYVGMTNDLARRISEHRAGEIPGFTADYRCGKLIYLLRTLHRRARRDCARKATQEMVASKESGIGCNSQPTLD
jgi:predicted GIY-YIG superfamily endonuclease